MIYFSLGNYIPFNHHFTNANVYHSLLSQFVEIFLYSSWPIDPSLDHPLQSPVHHLSNPFVRMIVLHRLDLLFPIVRGRRSLMNVYCSFFIWWLPKGWTSLCSNLSVSIGLPTEKRSLYGFNLLLLLWVSSQIFKYSTWINELQPKWTIIGNQVASPRVGYISHWL